jgi:tetratricopeptide (TPR) repeat protein
VSPDWYRSATWSPAVARDFQARLRRAREANREQYLLIQAGTLQQAHPNAALDLLDQYFALPLTRPSPEAHVVRAKAFLALGRLHDAIESYEAALAREQEFPNILTQAYLDLPYSIAEHQVNSKYDRALEVLRDRESRPAFPIERFRWNAIHALIFAERGPQHAARDYAQRALAVAADRDSGFRNHPSLGLVGDESADLVRRMRSLAAGSKSSG